MRVWVLWLGLAACGGRVDGASATGACSTPVAVVDCSEQDFFVLEGDSTNDAGARTGVMHSCRSGCAPATHCEALVSGYGFVDGVCE